MTDHEIMLVQTLEHAGQDVEESSVQAFCSCGRWSSATVDNTDEIDAEFGEHLYLDTDRD